MRTWRSKALPWIVLTAFVGVGLATRFGGREEEPRPGMQNLYASRAACERDYESDQCVRGGGGHPGYYAGPRYAPGSNEAMDPGPGRTAANGRSVAALDAVSAPISRGGFGETARGGGGGYEAHYGGG